MIWLSYMLIQTKSGENNSLNEVYTKHIENDERYKKEINGVTAYKDYKDLIDRNSYFLSMDKSIISKLYDALTSLCSMYVNEDGHVPTCDEYLKLPLYDLLLIKFHQGLHIPILGIPQILDSKYYW
ncbi:hypothetical protein YYC_01103 [Plasmodium yoelii 17X]|uniref:Uncharacterized protein n=1 Tax=Plasmodium yoelii 17X TaxID=1323249 RepID=V7PVF1_PLAYE|nr:hypothetical protein YYC_01103 [Plasmodium yoelii 17X]